MSVEKVNYYKEQKSHRKENLAKEKRRKRATRAGWIALGLVVAAGLCGAVGLTGYNAYRNAQAAKPDYSASSLMLTDVAGVLETEAAELEEEVVSEEAGAEETEAVTAGETEAATAEETAAAEETAEAE